MMDWSLTKQVESSVRSGSLVLQKVLQSWMSGSRKRWVTRAKTRWPALKLDEWLSQTLGHQSKDQMACIIETTHGLLIAFLLEHGWPVYPVNPRTVDRKRSASGAKTETIDAYLLAKTGRADFADLHRLTPDSEKVAELKTLTRDQDSLLQMQTRLVNQLTACLKDYYPVALHLFSKLQQKSTLLFLQTYPTPQKALQASREQMAQTLKQAGPTRAGATAANIFETLHQPHLSANDVTTQSTQHEPWAKAYYERKRARCGKSHSVAVRALSNIWARIIFAMLTSHKPYVSATFETAKQLHALQAA